MQSTSIVNEYLKKLQQAAWRLQYYERRIVNPSATLRSERIRVWVSNLNICEAGC